MGNSKTLLTLTAATGTGHEPVGPKVAVLRRNVGQLLSQIKMKMLLHLLPRRNALRWVSLLKWLTAISSNLRKMRTAMAVLKERFHRRARPNLRALREELQHIKLEASMTVDDLIDKIDTKQGGTEVSDIDKQCILISALPDDYSTLIANFDSKITTEDDEETTNDDICGWVRVHEVTVNSKRIFRRIK